MSKSKSPKSASPVPDVKEVGASVGNWQDEVAKLDMKTLYAARPCEFILLIERDLSCTKLLNQFHYKCGLDNKNPIRAIRYEDVIRSVSSSVLLSSNSMLQLPNVLLDKASPDVINYIKNGNRIPSNLLAKLIKLYLCKVLNDDIVKVKQEKSFAKEMSGECRELLIKADLNVAAVVAAAKAPPKGKAEPVEENVCGSVKEEKPLKLKSTFITPGEVKQKAIEEDLEIESKTFYITLVSFYDLDLINQLAEIGIKIDAIFEVAYPEEISSVEQIPDVPEVKKDSPTNVSLPIINSDSLIELYSDTKNKNYYDLKFSSSSFREEFRAFRTPEKAKRKKAPKLPPMPADVMDEDMECEALDTFWFNVHQNECSEFFDCLKNTYSIKYTIKGTKKSSNLQDIFDLAIFEISEYILEVTAVKRKHVTYLRNLKMIDLGPQPKPITSKYLKNYKNLLKRYPPECISIPVIVNCLLDEVCCRVPDPVKVAPVKEASTYSFIQNLLDAESAEMTERPKRKDVNIIKVIPKTHPGLDTDLFSVYDNQRSYFENNDEKVKFMKDIPLHGECKPFVVHELNLLEIKCKSYNSIYNQLFLDNMMPLMNGPFVTLWKNYPELGEDLKLMNEYNYYKWSNCLEMKKVDMLRLIDMKCLEFLKCDEYRLANNRRRASLSEMFPCITNSLQAHEAATEVDDIDCPSSYDDIAFTFKANENSLYEIIDLPTYKWIEELPATVMLQVLNTCFHNYICCDHTYNPITDHIIIRFHNDADNFGINTKIWNQSLRTPVHLRDFCKFVIHEDSDWLDQKEKQYRHSIEVMTASRAQLLKDKIYSRSTISDKDFILSGSYKDVNTKQSMDSAKQVGSLKLQKSGSAVKGGSKKDIKGGLSEVVFSTDTSKTTSTDWSSICLENPQLVCAKADEPFNFTGFELGNTRLQLEGSTTTFHSFDGMRIKVDRTRWNNSPKNFSVQASVRDCSVIVYRHEALGEEPFSFHIRNFDDTFIVFGRPTTLIPPERVICDKICQEVCKKKIPKSIFKPKKQPIYCVSERHTAIVKCVKVPFIAKKTLVMEEGAFKELMKLMSAVKIKSLVDPALLQPIRRPVENDPAETGSLGFVVPEYRKNDLSPLPKVIVKKEEEPEPPQTETYNIPIVFKPIKYDQRKVMELKKRAEILKKVREALDKHVPAYKICSSKLHQYRYVSRIKSHINIQVGNVVKRLLCKPRYCVTKRSIEVTKCFPICTEDICKMTPCHYNLRATLPSGLTVHSVQGIDSKPFYIKQSYLEKGPLADPIKNECSRSFMRDGHVVIKKTDGTIEILGVGGTITTCEIPYFKQRINIKSNYEVVKKKKLSKYCKHEGIHNIHTNNDCGDKFRRVLRRLIRRRQKHMIGGNTSPHLFSRRAYLRNYKKYFKNSKSVFLAQNVKNPFVNYSILNNDGTKINVKNRYTSETGPLAWRAKYDHRYEEIYYQRQDGFHVLIDNDGLMQSQFPDGTRISTWFTISPDMISMDMEPTIDDNKGSQVDMEEEEDEFAYLLPLCMKKTRTPRVIPMGDWVYLDISYQFEHPNYASVTYDGLQDNVEVSFPNDIIINATGAGIYNLALSEYLCCSVTPSSIVYESNLCRTCQRSCIAEFNIEPLYNERDLTTYPEDLLVVTDSFKKIFRVDYEGKCCRNAKYIQQPVNRMGCTVHRYHQPQKLYIVNRSLGGGYLWDTEEYRRTLTNSFRRHDARIYSYGGNITTDASCFEIRTFMYFMYGNRFLNTYEQPVLTLKTKRKRRRPCIPAYSSQRLIFMMISMDRLFPLLETMEHFLAYRYHPDTEQESIFNIFITDLMNNNREKIVEMTLEDEPLLEEKPSNSALEFQRKWTEWYDQCQIFKSYLRKGENPSYFDPLKSRVSLSTINSLLYQPPPTTTQVRDELTDIEEYLRVSYDEYDEMQEQFEKREAEERAVCLQEKADAHCLYLNDIEPSTEKPIFVTPNNRSQHSERQDVACTIKKPKALRVSSAVNTLTDKIQNRSSKEMAREKLPLKKMTQQLSTSSTVNNISLPMLTVTPFFKGDSVRDKEKSVRTETISSVRNSLFDNFKKEDLFGNDIDVNQEKHFKDNLKKEIQLYEALTGSGKLCKKHRHASANSFEDEKKSILVQIFECKIIFSVTEKHLDSDFMGFVTYLFNGIYENAVPLVLLSQLLHVTMGFLDEAMVNGLTAVQQATKNLMSTLTPVHKECVAAAKGKCPVKSETKPTRSLDPKLKTLYHSIFEIDDQLYILTKDEFKHYLEEHKPDNSCCSSEDCTCSTIKHMGVKIVQPTAFQTCPEDFEREKLTKIRKYAILYCLRAAIKLYLITQKTGYNPAQLLLIHEVKEVYILPEDMEVHFKLNVETPESSTVTVCEVCKTDHSVNRSMSNVAACGSSIVRMKKSGEVVKRRTLDEPDMVMTTVPFINALTGEITHNPIEMVCLEDCIVPEETPIGSATSLVECRPTCKLIDVSDSMKPLICDESLVGRIRPKKKPYRSKPMLYKKDSQDSMINVPCVFESEQLIKTELYSESDFKARCSGSVGNPLKSKLKDTAAAAPKVPVITCHNFPGNKPRDCPATVRISSPPKKESNESFEFKNCTGTQTYCQEDKN